MADLRIADAPEIALENITGNEKVPTGGYGNSAVTITNIGEFARTTLSLATESYVSNAVGQKENKITLTGLNLTPTSTLVEVPQTNNSVLNTIHQDLLNRMEWIKDNATVITDHQALTNRTTFNTHPSSSISHNGTSNVSIEIEELKNDVLTINITTVPELKNDIVGKQDVIVNDNDLSDSSEFSNVPSTNNNALNNSLQALVNRDKFVDDKIKTGLPPVFNQEFSNTTGGYPLNSRLMLTNGDIVRSTIANNTTNPNVDMTGWSIVNSASQIVDEIYNITQSVINGNLITVDNFGAKGDGVTDDSAAFQAYCDSALTGANILLANRKAVYVIKKQVNCKGKGIVGNGFSKQNETAYSTSSIRVQAGDFSNTNTALNNIAFINVGAEVRNLQLKGDSVPSVHGLQVSGYNTTISNINISGFGNQIHVLGASVSFRVSDLMSISASNAGVYFKDQNGDQSTTAYFTRCSWQWGNKPVVFEKEAYGCSFRDIILEYMGGGLEASVWSNCIFDGVWAEQTRDGTAKDWLINTAHQQSFNNQYSNLYIRSPWLDRASPSSLAVSNNAGGVQIDNSGIAVASATGSKILFNELGLSTRFANWFSGSNRRLRITSQANAAESGYKTPIYIDAPNNELYFGNQDETSVTPVTFKRLIGALADGTTRFFGVDMWTKRMRKWQAYDHTVNASGQFVAPMMLTYDAAWVDTQQQNNAGWKITKEAGTTGVYILQRTATTVAPMSNPNIIIGGFHVGSRVGNGAFVTASLQAIETYSGSWTDDLVSSGFKIFCRDQTGALVNVNRFTVMFTLASGF